MNKPRNLRVGIPHEDTSYMRSSWAWRSERHVFWFVIGGRDNAPLGWISLTADDNGFSCELRSPFLLNSGEEGVHVDMKDSPFHGLAQ